MENDSMYKKKAPTSWDPSECETHEDVIQNILGDSGSESSKDDSVGDLIEADREALKRAIKEIAKSVAQTKRAASIEVAEDIEKLLGYLEETMISPQKHLGEEKREEVRQIHQKWKM